MPDHVDLVIIMTAIVIIVVFKVMDMVFVIVLTLIYKIKPMMMLPIWPINYVVFVGHVGKV